MFLFYVSIVLSACRPSRLRPCYCDLSDGHLHPAERVAVGCNSCVSGDVTQSFPRKALRQMPKLVDEKGMFYTDASRMGAPWLVCYLMDLQPATEFKPLILQSFCLLSTNSRKPSSNKIQAMTYK